MGSFLLKKGLAGVTMAKDYNPAMHTAEHILNAVMTKRYGSRSFSTHVEKKKTKADYRTSSAPADDDIISIENEINRIIGEMHEVTENFITRTEAEDTFNLEKLPESAGDRIRIVQIGSYDKYPCIGEHVNNTSEIGILRIYSHDFNDGVLRLRFRLE
jgi:misacylated tRNA(Ala) deacylase